MSTDSIHTSIPWFPVLSDLIPSKLCIYLTVGSILPAWGQAASRAAAPLPPTEPVAIAIGSTTSATPLETPPLLWNVLHPWNDPLGLMPEVPAARTTAALPDELVSTAAAPCPDEASANDPVPTAGAVLALPQAIDLALCRNAQIRASWSEIRQQAAQVGVARAAYWPTVNAAVGRLDDRTTYPDTPYPTARERSHRTNLTVNWRVFDFGARSADLQAARSLLDAALASRNAAILKTILQVLQTYTQTQTARASWRIRQDQQTLAARTLESARRREKLGAGARTDTLQAQAALSRTTLQASQAQGQWQEAHAALVYTLGLPTGSSVELPSVLAATTLPEAGRDRDTLESRVFEELDHWLAAARQNHPAIVAARLQWQAAAAKVRATQAEGLPSVDLSLGYYDNGRPTQDLTSYRSHERTIGITLNIPLFDGFAHTYRVAGAEAQAQAKRIQYEDTAENTLLDLVKLRARARAAWRNLVAAAASERASEAAETSTRRQFDKGVTDMLHLLQSQNDLLAARLQRLQTALEWQGVRLEMVINSHFETAH